jgi:uncharacterized protein
MSWLNRLGTGLLLATVASVSQAAEVQNMYEVQVPVTDQNQETRQAAFALGFAEVLVRVSGSSTLPAINMTQASSYVQQYRYVPVEKPEIAVPVKAGEPVMTHNVWLRFDEAAIKKLLRSNGLSVWGSQRPDVLVWLAVRDGPSRYILGRNDVSPIRDAVAAQGVRRGIPLIWPLYDDKESKKVAFTDVWGGFFEQVSQASQRYNATAILIGRMDWQKKAGWQIDWSLLQDGKQLNWQQRSTELPVLMAGGINPVADLLAARFAVIENPTGVASLTLQVNGVTGAEAYTQVEQYLRSLALVRQVFATNISPGQVQFRLDINGGEADLRRIIALERTLTPEGVTELPTAPAVAAPVILRYRLN